MAVGGEKTDDEATIDSIVYLANAVIPELEKKWKCVIEVDLSVLQECIVCAEITLGSLQVAEPNEIKQAGHYACWIRKLKPLRVVNASDVATEVGEMVRDGLLTGAVESSKAVSPKTRRLFVNEMFALLVAVGVAKLGGYEISLKPAKANDLVVSLRYHSFSPSAVTAILAAYATDLVGGRL